MAGKINFVIAFHLHQPVGNFESVFQKATVDSYRPLLEALSEHPSIPFGLHVSGPVWEFWEKEHSDMFPVIDKMVQSGQCELLGGGFYEPILCVIPRNDAVGQLKMMEEYIERKFGVVPRGIWLTERIWEPHLPGLLCEAGIKYLAVDDYHLKSVGIVEAELLRYFITEDNGDCIAIFPISEILRYTMPFAPVEKTIEYLKYIASDECDRLIVFADDGEKFGLWPGTHQWVWGERWMEKFLTAIEQNRDWINLISFSEALEKLQPGGRIYMPTGSYFEMNEWTLPARLSFEFHKWVKELKQMNELERLRPFVKGGFWRNFLAKYSEANWMHKRMLWLSRQITERKRRLKNSLSAAKMALYKSQCNCAYWHGIFGGLYLPHLRTGVWRNILEAENIIESKSPTRPFLSEDIDCDGRDEVRISNGETVLWIAPHRGAEICEISFLPTKTNLTDVLARHREGYHRILLESPETVEETEHASIHDRVSSKEEGLEKILHYDRYPKRFAQEHFLLTYVGRDDFERLDYQELGNFIDGQYEIVSSRKLRGSTEILFSRDGAIVFEGRNFPITVRKKISLCGPGSRILTNYEIENHSDWLEFFFAVETNFSLMSRDNPHCYFLFPHETLMRIHPGDRQTFFKVDGYELIDEERGFRISCRCFSDSVWMFPVETVSNSEEGFERVYQGTSLIHLFRFNLSKGERYSTEIMWKIEQLLE